MHTQYDYIIAGAGCAGLSLLNSMMQHAFFSNKKILLIDKAQKNDNDRTWCFWEQQPGLFEDIVYHRWQQIDFFSNQFSARFNLKPYEYKLIRSIDLYTTVLNKAALFSNIDIVYDEVVQVSSYNNRPFIKTHNGIQVSASYIFNSLLPANWMQKARQQKEYLLLQHFAGWWIKTSQDAFDAQTATFMDFKLGYENSNSFMYVLPVTKNKALVEYTVFSEEILTPRQYADAIEAYIHSTLKIKEYTVLQKEWGVIPMTSYTFPAGKNNIINIGTAGGQTKGSSGFTFQFIQKHIKKITEALLAGKNPLQARNFFEKRFKLYDDILLNVLINNKLDAGAFFGLLFKKNSVNTILRFLDNETNFKQELNVMRTVPINLFLHAACKELLLNKSIFRQRT